MCISLFLESLYYSVDLSIFMPVVYSLYSHSFIIRCEIRQRQLSQLSSFSSCFDFFRPFEFLHDIQNQFGNFYQKQTWDFDSNCIESVDQFGKNGHLNNESSDPRTSKSLTSPILFFCFFSFLTYKSHIFLLPVSRFRVFFFPIVNGIMLQFLTVHC